MRFDLGAEFPIKFGWQRRTAPASNRRAPNPTEACECELAGPVGKAISSSPVCSARYPSVPIKCGDFFPFECKSEIDRKNNPLHQYKNEEKAQQTPEHIRKNPVQNIHNNAPSSAKHNQHGCPFTFIINQGLNAVNEIKRFKLQNSTNYGILYW